MPSILSVVVLLIQCWSPTSTFMMLPSTVWIRSVTALVCMYTLIQEGHYVKAGYRSDTHECLRTCEWPPKPKICRYDFTIELFHTMSTDCMDCPHNQTHCYRPQCIPADGVPRAIIVINKLLPGPSIQVCEHDTIEVKVQNNLINGESVAIHWHGIHQRGTPHMDGVPLVTQCPIPYRSSFTYKFKAETVGTHFWHVHGAQLPDGAFGSLVVRQAAPNDVHSSLYDHDLAQHVIFVHDWIHEIFIERYIRFFLHGFDDTPDTLMFNGEGRHAKFVHEVSNDTIYTPRHEVHVERNQRYRFRVIANAGLECTFQVSVDEHNLTVIASDGAPFQPIQVAALGLSSGERFDFVLNTRQEVGKYWMRITGREFCAGMKGLALLIYEGADGLPDPPEEETPSQMGVLLNPFNMKSSPGVVTTNELIAIGDDTWTGEETTDVVYYIGSQLGLINNPNYNHPVYNPTFGVAGDKSTFRGPLSPQLNHVTYKSPTKPLLTQSREVSEFEFCSFESTQAAQQHCRIHHCECTHVLEIELGKVVELVLIDNGLVLNNSHPMHLHGYRFQVLAMDKLGDMTSVDEVKGLDEAGNITRRYLNAPLKDTVPVPDGGYVVVRFKADNPGWWFFHCHVELHMLAGMSLVIHVGSDDDLPPIPQDLPRCGGDWYPKEDPMTGGLTPTAMPNSAAIAQDRTGIPALVCVFASVMLPLFSKSF
ncbi:oxidoreductase OpS5-like [Patiria miniata]|uniref:Laccase n=1 Tax=Patiria miniata TaxID=46514 RepID=A0A913ZGY8_PATMI|nr:oxidoreductase OpS5-like [Patiria miniata]